MSRHTWDLRVIKWHSWTYEQNCRPYNTCLVLTMTMHGLYCLKKHFYNRFVACCIVYTANDTKQHDFIVSKVYLCVGPGSCPFVSGCNFSEEGLLPWLESLFTCAWNRNSFPLSMLFWSGFNDDGMGQDLLRSWSLFSVIFMIMTSKLLCKSCANVIGLKWDTNILRKS